MTESTKTPSSGYSREEAENFLKNFLRNENYQLLVIKGQWGVGKTYLVQNFFSEHKQEYYYYYASFFGITSIEELKGRIVAHYNQPDSNYGSKSKKNVVNWISRIAPKIEQIPNPLGGSLVTVVGDLAFNIFFSERVRNSIICIDDLGRRSKLPLDDLLEFVEYLIQELNCFEKGTQE